MGERPVISLAACLKSHSQSSRQRSHREEEKETLIISLCFFFFWIFSSDLSLVGNRWTALWLTGDCLQSREGMDGDLGGDVDV